MSEEYPDLDFNNLEQIKRGVPEEDYICEKFDYQHGSNLTDILFILSTPRSGSTLLSGLVYKNGICIPHEYFQPYQYMQVLASRWGCVNNGNVDIRKYLKKLISRRTSTYGWMGINLHGEHLQGFSKFEEFLPDVNRHYIHIVRKDEISQAISYEMAMQTNKWSSHYNTETDPIYDFDGVLDKLKLIRHQNTLIKAYLTSRGIQNVTMYYEDIVSAPKEALESILPQKHHDSISVMTDLKKQSSHINEEWKLRFSQDFYYEYGEHEVDKTDKEYGIKKLVMSFFKGN